MNQFRHRSLALATSGVMFAFSGFSSAQYIVPRSQFEDFGPVLGAAPSSVPRPMLSIGVGLIIEFEGWRPTAYDDPVGLCTIGFGHLIAMKSCSAIDLKEFSGTLSRAQGTNLLELDTRTSRAIVQRLVTRELDDAKYSALSSFVFNVGKEKFSDSTLLILVNSREDQLASREFLRWVRSKGKFLRGLQERRSCESEMFLGRLVGDANGDFLRKECSGVLGAAPAVEREIDIDVGEIK